MPAVSVVIPTRNRAEILKVAIASVFAQTYSDLELIIVIDGPDQTTEDSLKRISDHRLKVVVNPSNVGLAEARNVGVRHTQGKWVAFLDDDDEWLPEKLTKQIQKAQSVAGTHVLVVSRFLEQSNNMERVWPELLPESAHRLSEYMYLKRGLMLPSTYFVSRQLLTDIPFTPGLRHLEDVDWLLRIADDPRTQITAVPDCLTVYNNFHTPGRESLVGRWQVYLNWAVNHRHLFTPFAFSLYIVKTIVPKAKLGNASARELLYLLTTALLLGSFRPRVLFFFIASACFTADFKRQVRESISPRARSARKVSKRIHSGAAV